MPIPSRCRARQGELFSRPAQLPPQPQEIYKPMVRLLARMMNEHLQKDVRPNAHAEVGDE